MQRNLLTSFTNVFVAMTGSRSHNVYSTNCITEDKPEYVFCNALLLECLKT